MKQGNIIVLAMIFIAICIVVILFIATIFMSHVNSVLYNVKLEMYSINKSAILAVNKVNASMDRFSYNNKEYKKQFEEGLKRSFDLNEKFENKDKLIESVKVLEYSIIEKGGRDTFTRQNCDDRVIHTVTEVKVKPIIMRSIFEKIFTFTVHEDVNLNFAY